MIGPEGVDPAFFHRVYEGQPGWDVGRPQPEVVALLDAGRLGGRVLDVGCGTGVNAVLLAQRGATVTAVDLVPAAVDATRRAADAAGVPVEALVADALQLDHALAAVHDDEAQGTFDVVLDSGVFHVFSDVDRPRYVEQLRAMVRPGGWVHVIVFSDAETGDDGPRRVRREELSVAFKGWEMEEIVATRYAIRSRPDGARAWRGSWQRPTG